MTKKEQLEQDNRLFEIYCGLLFGDRFEEGEPVPLYYHFACPEFAVLRKTYGLEKIAGKGGDFSMALNLCRWLAPNLMHEGDFFLTEGHEMPYNSLALLEYAFGRKDRGLNCACKAKILTECCLALGIHARRVGLYPNSPYDIDNHVVVEIFDAQRKKWCMLDPTTGGYFTDGTQPLSCPEMRATLSQRQGSAVLPHQRGDLKSLAARNASWNLYYAKNSYSFTVETVSGFGTGTSRDACLVPLGFDSRARNIKNAEFLLEKAKDWNWDEGALERIRRWAEEVRERRPLVGSLAMWNPPSH